MDRGKAFWGVTNEECFGICKCGRCWCCHQTTTRKALSKPMVPMALLSDVSSRESVRRHHLSGFFSVLKRERERERERKRKRHRETEREREKNHDIDSLEHQNEIYLHTFIRNSLPIEKRKTIVRNAQITCDTERILAYTYVDQVVDFQSRLRPLSRTWCKKNLFIAKSIKESNVGTRYF